MSAAAIQVNLEDQIDADRPVKFSPRRLAHANIFVGQLERSLAFYHDVCGIEIVGTELGIRAGFLSNGNSHHDVGCVEIASAERVGRDGHVIVLTCMPGRYDGIDGAHVIELTG